MNAKERIARRRFLGGTVAIGAAAAMGVGDEAKAEGSFDGAIAIELFTSQGCSSCPPADGVLGDLARRADVVALSFHVDYWNYIGWKDPFSSAQTTERQHAYGRALRQESIYTPEMVVDGRAHTPGVYQGKLAELIKQARQTSGPRATPVLSLNRDNTLSVNLDDHRLDTPTADVLLALYDKEHETSVTRGENDGRTLKNFNVVRRFEKIATWDGARANWSIHDLNMGSSQGLAVLIQRPGNGPMIGSAKLEHRQTA